MIFSLEVLRALKGDCLLLHYGTREEPRLMLVDGGPAGVYTNELKPRLIQLRTARRLEPTDALPIDVVMVSHIDDDHINGVLALADEQKDGLADLRVDVSSLWFNSFDDILGSSPGEPAMHKVTASILASANPATDDDDVEENAAVEVLSSVPQGMRLRDAAKEFGWTPNHIFDDKPIRAVAGAKPVEMDGLHITVVGPMEAELEALQEEHDDWLRKHRAGHVETAAETLAAVLDQSVPNLSSIVMLVEAVRDGSKKRILLTGDARGDKIVDGLKLAGALRDGKPLHVDILKMQHHGSKANIPPCFFSQITADHYVFSGDGKHGNPDRVTLEMLAAARDDNAPFAIHLTYQIDDIDKKREADWIKEQTKERKRQAKKPEANVRDDWSPEKNGLRAFFAAHPALEKRVSVVAKGKPHLIDLGEAL